MKRSLKALGLAVVAALAMSAMTASAAQAEENADFWAAEEPAHIDTTNASHGVHEFETSRGTLTCTEVTGTATLQEEAASLTSESVEYETCHVVRFGFTFPVTVDMNGCDYNFTAGTMVEAGTKSEGSVHVECPDEKEITITIFAVGTQPPHEENLRCTIHVPEQTPQGTITYHNGTTEGKMAVTVTAHGLKVTETITNAGNNVCPEHEHNDATYNGSFWSKATNAAGTAFIDTTVTGTP